MPKKTPVQPRKSPRQACSQARSQATVAAILQAAARVLAQSSLLGFNTKRVAEVAGVSVGSLYPYFPNKTALITALIEQAHEDLAQSMVALLSRYAGRDLPRWRQATLQSKAQDCIVLTQALVDASAEQSQQAPGDLEDRVVQMLMGYLLWRKA